MTDREATCACGQLRLRCHGEPRKVSICHCRDCQRRTGSAFSVAVFFERTAFELVAGAVRQFSRDSASGHPVTFSFCPDCGSNVFWEPARMPALVGVALGAFADPSFPAPEQAVFVKDRHGWIGVPAGMRLFDALPEQSRPQETLRTG